MSKSINSKEQLLEELKVLLDNFFFNIKRTAIQPRCEQPLAEGQFFLMFALWEHNACKVSDISNRLGLTAGAITAMADKLVEADLIQRQRSEDDRRVVWLSLTEQGREVIKKVQNSRFELVRQRFNGLSEEDLEQAVQVFTKLNFQLSADKE